MSEKYRSKIKKEQQLPSCISLFLTDILHFLKSEDDGTADDEPENFKGFNAEGSLWSFQCLRSHDNCIEGAEHHSDNQKDHDTAVLFQRKLNQPHNGNHAGYDSQSEDKQNRYIGRNQIPSRL